jgi:hypothetical protein
MRPFRECYRIVPGDDRGLVPLVFEQDKSFKDPADFRYCLGR